jgi:septal ring factor EnvC (AmiA/AmiB activator)
MSNIMNPDGTHKVIANHAVYLSEVINRRNERITELEAEQQASDLAFDIVQKKYEAMRAERDKLQAELKVYKSFADTYIEKRYANLPQLRADLKALDKP